MMIRFQLTAFAFLVYGGQATVGEEGAYSKYFDGHYEVAAYDTAFKWLESPLWSETGRYLLFTDVKWEDPNANPPNATSGAIWKYDPATNTTTQFLRSAGIVGPGTPPSNLASYSEAGPNGMIWSWEGDPTLLVCQHGMGRIVRFSVNDVSGGSIDASKVTVVADSYNGSALNSPNDLVLIDGKVLFTDPPYGLQFFGDGGLGDAYARMPQHDTGVYALSSASSGPELILSGHYRPNGISVSSYKKVFIQHTDHDRPGYSVYDFAEGQFPRINASSAKRFHMTHVISDVNWKGVDNSNVKLADGITSYGDVIFAAGPGGVYVLNGETGEEVAFARINDLVSNVEAGGGYLYITANLRLLRIKLANTKVSETTANGPATVSAAYGYGFATRMCAFVCLMVSLISW